MGKCSNMNIMRYGVNVNEPTTPKSNCIRNAFFSETINQTQSKLHRNVHWIVLYEYSCTVRLQSDLRFETFFPYGPMLN
jgi:hypothetical protein